MPLLLLAVGVAPFVAVFLLVASMLLAPDFFGRCFDLFGPAGVDAPDNWAVGIHRMVWLSAICCSIGFTLCCIGLLAMQRGGSCARRPAPAR